MADVTVRVEEHPELDNPLGKAEGHVEACKTYLAEAKDVVKRLAGKVERAKAALEQAKAQHADAKQEVPVCERNLADAEDALAELEGAEQ